MSTTGDFEAEVGRLLDEVGAVDHTVGPVSGPTCAAADWARSGALGLTGWADRDPILPTAPIATAANIAAHAFDALLQSPLAHSDEPRTPEVPDGAELLGERARLEGLSRNGRIAAGGASRLLQCADEWLVVGLPRGDEDVRLFPAWLGIDPGEDPWERCAHALTEANVDTVLERGRLLGLPIAKAAATAEEAVPPWLERQEAGARSPGTASSGERRNRPAILDLTSLWAGPLCGRLLARAGAEVTKLESSQRPDGARLGAPMLFDALNRQKTHASCDFTTARGRAELTSCFEEADIVLEAARPRALRQLGFDAEAWLAARPGRVWASITGYGRQAPGSDWVALGDDAAAAAGLFHCIAADEAPLFVGDAVADPLTGLHAAVAVLAAWQAGGGALLDISLSGTVERAIGLAECFPVHGEVVRHERALGVETELGFIPATGS